MTYVSRKDLAAVVEAARFFTYVGQCHHGGYVSAELMSIILRDQTSFENWQRYDCVRYRKGKG